MPSNLSANIAGICITRKKNRKVVSENEIKIPSIFLLDRIYKQPCLVIFHKIIPGIFITWYNIAGIHYQVRIIVGILFVWSVQGCNILNFPPKPEKKSITKADNWRGHRGEGQQEKDGPNWHNCVACSACLPREGGTVSCLLLFLWLKGQKEELSWKEEIKICVYLCHPLSLSPTRRPGPRTSTQRTRRSQCGKGLIKRRPKTALWTCRQFTFDLVVICLGNFTFGTLSVMQYP